MKKIVVFLLLVSSLFPSGCSRPKQYADYSRHSGFDRTEIDSATLRNLEVLGRVWGFVKYHHPAFSDDRYDLDFELFELLPLVADTAPAARNEILAQWIDGFGQYKTAPGKYEKILTSDSVFEHRTDIGWIRDTATLSRELSERLVRLRSADRTALRNLWPMVPQSLFRRRKTLLRLVESRLRLSSAHGIPFLEHGRIFLSK